MTAATGLADDRSWTYDLDGNRLTAVTGTGTTNTDTFTYNRTDQLINVSRNGGGGSNSFVYDVFGNMTKNAESVFSQTSYSYDVGSRLTGIDLTGTANDSTFSYDALSRIRTRLIGSTTDTYSYAGTSESVIRIATSGVTDPVDSAVDAAGNRLGVRQGTSAFAWLLPDLHGNVAAQLDASASSIAYAIRYDPWGEIVDTGPGTTSGTSGKTWTYQGRLDLNPPAAAEPLLDGGARLYSPGLGTFTGLDSVSGGVQDPL